LTYAQCDLPREALLDLLTELITVEIDEYCIAKEAHADGSPHLHAYLKFASNFRSRDCRCFDVAGFHPNIERPRSIKAVIKYVQKDGDFLVSPGIEDLLNKKSYGSILATATTAEEFFEAIAKNFPRDYVLQYDRIKSFALEKYVYAL